MGSKWPLVRNFVPQVVSGRFAGSGVGCHTLHRSDVPAVSSATSLVPETGTANFFNLSRPREVRVRPRLAWFESQNDRKCAASRRKVSISFHSWNFQSLNDFLQICFQVFKICLIGNFPERVMRYPLSSSSFCMCVCVCVCVCVFVCVCVCVCVCECACGWAGLGWAGLGWAGLWCETRTVQLHPGLITF